VFLQAQERSERGILRSRSHEIEDLESRVDLRVQPGRWPDDGPPEDQGAPEEHDVFEDVEDLMLERGLVQKRHVPDPEDDHVIRPGDRQARQDLEDAADARLAREGPAHRMARAPGQPPQTHGEGITEEQQRRGHHGEQQVLGHVRREPGVGEVIEGGREGDRDRAEAGQI